MKSTRKRERGGRGKDGWRSMDVEKWRLTKTTEAWRAETETDNKREIRNKVLVER